MVTGSGPKWARNPYYTLLGRHNFGPGRQFQQIYLPRKATGVHLTGALGQGVRTGK